MQFLKELGTLFRKELTLEWRQKYAISGILLYVLSTVFIVYSSISDALEPSVWNMLFWIIFLFASVNAIVKSFQQESSGRQLYYYQLANPAAILVSKLLYNFLLLLVLSILSFMAFSLVAGNMLLESLPFYLALLLGSLGFSITFTFISAISSKTSNSATLMAILGFPLVIPILMTLINLASKAITQGPMKASYQGDILSLVAIDLLLIAAALILFPYLWRD